MIFRPARVVQQRGPADADQAGNVQPEARLHYNGITPLAHSKKQAFKDTLSELDLIIWIVPVHQKLQTITNWVQSITQAYDLGVRFFKMIIFGKSIADKVLILASWVFGNICKSQRKIVLIR